MASKPRILVDLNVILDVIQFRIPFYDQSAQVLDAVVRHRAQGWVAEHSVTTLIYIITRVRDRQTAVNSLSGLLNAFTVATADNVVIGQALAWGWDDFEDAVQMAAAAASHCDYLITRNPRDFQAGPVPVVQPAAFLTLLE